MCRSFLTSCICWFLGLFPVLFEFSPGAPCLCPCLEVFLPMPPSGRFKVRCQASQGGGLVLGWDSTFPLLHSSGTRSLSLHLPGNSRSGCSQGCFSTSWSFFFPPLLPCWIILLWGFQSSSNSVFGMKSVVLNLHLWMFCLCIYLFNIYVSGAHRGQKRARELPEPEYRQQQATRLVSGFEPEATGEGVGAFNCWAVTPAQQLFYESEFLITNCYRGSL